MLSPSPTDALEADLLARRDLVPEKRSKVNNGFGSKVPFAELSWRALISVPCHRISYTVGIDFVVGLRWLPYLGKSGAVARGSPAGPQSKSD
jgi:hypothetical protein